MYIFCTISTINVCFLPCFLTFSGPCHRNQAQTMQCLKEGSFGVCSECVIPSYRIRYSKSHTSIIITANLILWISVSYHKADVSILFETCPKSVIPYFLFTFPAGTAQALKKRQSFWIKGQRAGGRLGISSDEKWLLPCCQTFPVCWRYGIFPNTSDTLSSTIAL